MSTGHKLDAIPVTCAVARGLVDLLVAANCPHNSKLAVWPRCFQGSSEPREGGLSFLILRLVVTDVRSSRGDSTTQQYKGGSMTVEHLEPQTSPRHETRVEGWATRLEPAEQRSDESAEQLERHREGNQDWVDSLQLSIARDRLDQCPKHTIALPQNVLQSPLAHTSISQEWQDELSKTTGSVVPRKRLNTLGQFQEQFQALARRGVKLLRTYT